VAHPINRVARRAWRANDFCDGDRSIPEETAIAFTYNGTSYAVMMATPQDLEDFACGFSLTEGIVSSLDEIEELDIVESEIGIELRMWLAEPQSAAFGDRRRRLPDPRDAGFAASSPSARRAGRHRSCPTVNCSRRATSCGRSTRSARPRR